MHTLTFYEQLLTLHKSKIMAQTINIQEIVNQIEMLDYRNKVNILAKVVSMINTEQKTTNSEPITNIKELGKRIWSNVDTKTYLATERGSWD
jgi:hypothetical protein